MLPWLVLVGAGALTLGAWLARWYYTNRWNVWGPAGPDTSGLEDARLEAERRASEEFEERYRHAQEDALRQTGPDSAVAQWGAARRRVRRDTGEY